MMAAAKILAGIHAKDIVSRSSGAAQVVRKDRPKDMISRTPDLPDNRRCAREHAIRLLRLEEQRGLLFDSRISSDDGWLLMLRLFVSQDGWITASMGSTEMRYWRFLAGLELVVERKPDVGPSQFTLAAGIEERMTELLSSTA